MPKPIEWPPVIVARTDPDRPKTECAWFLLCAEPATRIRQHPTLGAVPICDRCEAKVVNNGGERQDSE